MTPDLSVVMPVHNEARHLRATLAALSVAACASGVRVEIVLVDDGSTDNTVTVAERAVAGAVPLRVLSQRNLGRFAARRAGVEAARADLVLLLDGRITLDSEALVFVMAQIRDGSAVWTGHVRVQANGNLYGLFWNLLAELAWADYFDDPRTTSFGPEEFDRFPKGTGCFVAPRALLLEAIAAFRSGYRDMRHANDDAPLIRWISARERIHVSPEFACSYKPRTSMGAFLRHSFHRGLVFLDGHGRRASRFFPVVIAFYPVSALLAVSVSRRPRLGGAAVVATSLAAGALGVVRRRRPREVASLALLTPPYAALHGAGMWWGLLTRARERL